MAELLRELLVDLHDPPRQAIGALVVVFEGPARVAGRRLESAGLAGSRQRHASTPVSPPPG